MLEWIRFIFAALFIAAGVFSSITATFGVFKFKFIMNRMHSAAIGDTMAVFFIIIGLIIINGFNFLSLKLLLILLFFWFASPVSSHLLAKFEVAVDESVKDECEVIK